jgi:hypothetical protein
MRGDVMFGTRGHLSLEELILTADGDLSPRRLARARSHLADCPACRARSSQMEHVLQDANRACRDTSTRSQSPPAVARARLKLRLGEASSEIIRPRPLRILLPDAGSRRWAYAIAFLLAAALGLPLAPGGRGSDPSGQDGGAPRIFLLPRADLTPGAVRPVTIAEVCDSNRRVPIRPIPASVHERVFRDYGADYRRAAEYELDHLITPELGGTQDPSNLWPQPFGATAWNAYVKDELEQLFLQRVCEGRMPFAAAQHEMATDWIAAYKRHFHTDRPLRDYSTSPLTELDADLIRSELEELGIATDGGPAEGPVLMAMLRAARTEIHRLPHAGE